MVHQSEFEWTFSNARKTQAAEVDESGTNVTFHRSYSIGTAACCGNKPLEREHIHLWEFLLSKPVYGSSFMVGIGTADLDISKSEQTFEHLLGQDKNSWGFSHERCLHHDGQQLFCPSSPTWTKDMVIGIEANLWRGSLSFTINNVQVGETFYNIPRNKDLYPIVSSTAAKSGLRLAFSRSYPFSLFLQSIEVIGRHLKSPIEELPIAPAIQTMLKSSYGCILRNGKYKKSSEEAKSVKSTAINLKDLLESYRASCLELRARVPFCHIRRQLLAEQLNKDDLTKVSITEGRMTCSSQSS